MQAPPPTGCTGRAPPGVDGDGGAGLTLDEAAVAVATESSTDAPIAKANTATPPHNTAAALPLRFVITQL
jgi:hypothetical protein